MSAEYTWKGTVAATAIVSAYPDTSGNFWCDGAADDVEMAAAITYVGSLGGGTVFMRAGIYEGRFYIDNDNIVLRGAGKYNTVLRLPALPQDTKAQTLTIVADYVTIQDLQVDGNRNNQTFTIPTGGQCDGIAIYGDYYTIENCYVHDTINHGIIGWDIAATLANGANAIRNARAAVHDNQILYNVVENVGHSSYISVSIDSAFVSYNIKQIGNTVLGDGLYSAGIGGHALDNSIISNNYIYNIVGTAIGVSGGEGVVVSNNVIRDFIGDDVAQKAAISIVRTDDVLGHGDTRNIDIIGNVVENTTGTWGMGVRLYGTATYPISDINVEGNIFRDIAGASCIMGRNCYDVKISDNIIVAKTGNSYGIRFESNGNSDRIFIDSNDIRHQGAGVWIQLGDNFNIINNDIEYNGDATAAWHVLIDASVLTGIVRDNRLLGATTNPAIVADNLTIQGNRGYNPIGIIATPFDTPNTLIEINGVAATPVASTDYVVENADIVISSTNSGGVDCAILVKDPTGNSVLQAALANIEYMYVPRGFQINWGAFTGAAPTVTVAFI